MKKIALQSGQKTGQKSGHVQFFVTFLSTFFAGHVDHSNNYVLFPDRAPCEWTSERADGEQQPERCNPL